MLYDTLKMRASSAKKKKKRDRTDVSYPTQGFSIYTCIRLGTTYLVFVEKFSMKVYWSIFYTLKKWEKMEKSEVLKSCI